ncbi:hypothetical protein D3C81_1284930 [compost metagenome]
MQHRGHPPGKPLGLPHAAQADFRVFLQQIKAIVAVNLDQDVEQRTDVTGRQVQALGAGGRDDVRGIADQEHAPVLHRFDHEAAQRCDAFFDGRPRYQFVRQRLWQSRLEFVPEALIRPVIHMIAGGHLQVVTGACR